MNGLCEHNGDLKYAVTIRPATVQMACRLFYRVKTKKDTVSFLVCQVKASIPIHFHFDECAKDVSAVETTTFLPFAIAFSKCFFSVELV